MLLETRTRQRPQVDDTYQAANLEAREISAWFGDHQVLDRVSLMMECRQVTALIGPSGCGKSTFLRILNRMHELIPAASLAGDVLLDGVDIYDPSRKLTEARRHIGMVFQKPNPFPTMSIYDNVLAGLKLTGTRKDQDAKDELVESCLTEGRTVERGREPAAPAGRGALGWPAAAAVHRPGPGHPAPGAADGRAVLGPRPHLHPPDRDHHRGAARPRSPSSS